MNFSNLISIISFSILGVLILINYIYIYKPYNYLTVLIIIVPAILIKTPLEKNMNKSLELIFVSLYTLVSMLLILLYWYSIKKK